MSVALTTGYKPTKTIRGLTRPSQADASQHATNVDRVGTATASACRLSAASAAAGLERHTAASPRRACSRSLPRRAAAAAAGATWAAVAEPSGHWVETDAGASGSAAQPRETAGC